jgi:ribonuclease T2
MRWRTLVALAVLSSGTACAKKACEPPADLPRPMLEGPTVSEPRRLLPVAGYTLALSWAPEYCAGRATSPGDRIECGGEAGSFGFILHGLWPEGKGALWPQYCTPTRLVPEKLIREHLCSTPSVQLIQHQWEKHGTCMAKTPDEYFARSSALFTALRFPEMDDFSGKAVTAEAFRQAFAQANEGMRADQLRLKVSRTGWLQEVAVCLDAKFERRSCPARQDGASQRRTIRIRSR